MAFNKKNITQTIQSYLISVILGVVCLLVHVGEFSVPFIVYRNCSTTAERTAIESCYTYLLLCPMFIVPIVSLVAIIVSVCYSMVGMLMHFSASLFNIGAIIYFVLFFNDRYKRVYQDRSQQIVPPVVMGIAALISIICTIDCCRQFIVHKRNSGEYETPYRPLHGGPIHSYSSDSDSD